jgi:hypothetical protein
MSVNEAENIGDALVDRETEHILTPVATVIAVLTPAEAQALEWAADAGIEQLTAENKVSELSRDIKKDLEHANDGLAMLQKGMKDAHVYDARLIDAAPDLYAALRRMDALVDGLWKSIPWGQTFDLDIAALNEAPTAAKRALALLDKPADESAKRPISDDQAMKAGPCK